MIMFHDCEYVPGCSKRTLQRGDWLAQSLELLTLDLGIII